MHVCDEDDPVARRLMTNRVGEVIAERKVKAVTIAEGSDTESLSIHDHKLSPK